MYISKCVSVGKRNDKNIIYIPSHNRILLVSDVVLKSIDAIRKEYFNRPIDPNDENLVRLKDNNCYEVLVRNGVLTEMPDSAFKRYEEFSTNLYVAYLHVSQECNMNCDYCYAKHNLGKGMQMLIDDAKIYIDKLYNRGIKKYILTGGEPYLNDDLYEIVQYLRSKDDLHIDLLTNGTMIADNVNIIRLIDSCIVSLDVINSLNRRGVPSKQIIDNLKKIPDGLREKIYVRVVISKGEENKIDEMKSFIETLGYKPIFLPRLPNNKKDLGLFPDLNTVNFYDNVFEKLSMVKCGAATSEIAVDWEGTVYPCQNLMKSEHRITTLNDDDWFEQLCSSNMRSVIKESQVTNIDKCKECDYRLLCGGGCRALSYNVYGTYNHRLDFFCDFFKRDIIRCLNSVSFVEEK